MQARSAYCGRGASKSGQAKVLKMEIILNNLREQSLLAQSQYYVITHVLAWTSRSDKWFTLTGRHGWPKKVICVPPHARANSGFWFSKKKSIKPTFIIIVFTHFFPSRGSIRKGRAKRARIERKVFSAFQYSTIQGIPATTVVMTVNIFRATIFPKSQDRNPQIS